MSRASVQRLPDTLISRIAAGEVIERPASVVKELIENSLDAGASRIDIAVEASGLQLIRVSDDGVGMERSDVQVAARRHYTSKIASFEDLQNVSSLGFRGEALASIASVSEFELTSCAHTGAAWRIRIDNGEVVGGVDPAAHPRGTSVEIRGLFAKIPARRKFLRTPKTEFFHIQQLVKRIALSRFDTSFRLAHHGRRVMQLPAARQERARLGRIGQLYGQAFLRSAVPIDVEVAGIRVRGWVAAPDFSRNQADLQNLCLNGRIIKDRLLARAVRAAYGDAIADGRYPGYALYLDVAPAAVDVNVHPAKAEVRFRDPRTVHDVLYSIVRRALGGAADQNVPAMIRDGAAATGRSDYPAPAASAPAPDAPWRVYVGGSPERPGAAVRRPEAGSGGPERSLVPGTAVALIAKRYIVTTQSECLSIIDAVAARAQRRFAVLREAHRAHRLAAQPLLIPETIEPPQGVAAMLERTAPVLRGIGVDVSLTAAGQLRVLGLPVAVDKHRLGEVIGALTRLASSGAGDVHAVDAMLRVLADALPAELDDGADQLQPERALQEVEDGVRQGHVELSTISRRVDAALLQRLLEDPERGR